MGTRTEPTYEELCEGAGRCRCRAEGESSLREKGDPPMTKLEVEISAKGIKRKIKNYHTIKASDLCMLFPRSKAEALLKALEAGATVKLRKVEEEA